MAGIFPFARALEMQLKTSEEKYRTIVELAREGIFIVDAEDKLTFANEFLAGMLGSDPGEIIGRSVYDFMGEDARKLVKAQLERRRNGLSDSYELTLRREGWLLADQPGVGGAPDG